MPIFAQYIAYMYIVYINNFRGFKNTFLELKDTNFFVGENSTGKTSVMKLIHLLFSKKDWLSLDFNSEITGLGYFSEIVKPGVFFFEIGLIDLTDDGLVVKLTFVEKNGQPTLSLFEMRSNTSEFKLTFDGKEEPQLLYNLTKKGRIPVAFAKEWMKSNNEYKTKLKSEVFPLKYIRQFSADLLPLISMTILTSSGDNKSVASGAVSSRIFGAMPPLLWIAPIRTEPKRTYDSYRRTYSPDGSHSPYLLKDLLNEEKETKNTKMLTLEHFGEKSHLFDKIDIRVFNPESPTSPFEIQVILEGQPVKIIHVGYGVSQVLPVITEILTNTQPGTWFVIQQPEVHLHPKAQAELGSFFFNANRLEQKFIIETHSDYIIDRYRLVLRKYNTEKKKKDTNIVSQVVFFRRTPDGNELVQMPINADGTYPEEQPEDFRDFFINEQLNLLSL